MATKTIRFDIQNSNNSLTIKHLATGQRISLIMRNEDKEPENHINVEQGDINMAISIVKTLKTIIRSNKKVAYQQRLNKLAGQLRKCAEAKTWRVFFNQMEAKLPEVYAFLKEQENEMVPADQLQMA